MNKSVKIHIRSYPIWYSEIHIHDYKVYDEIADFICEYTGRQYSFRLVIEGDDFKEILFFHSQAVEIMSEAAKYIVEQAQKAIDDRGMDRLIFQCESSKV